MPTPITRQQLAPIAGSLASGKSDRVEKEELIQAGIPEELARAALATAGEDGLDLDEFLTFLAAQANPIDLRIGDATYLVRGGQVQDDEPTPPEGAAPTQEERLRAVDEYAVPAEYDPMQDIMDRLWRLSGGRITNPDGAFSAEFEKCKDPSTGKIKLDRQFRKCLAAALEVQVSEVTEAAVDAIWGNQDGKLDAEDTLTVEEFIERLKFAEKYFAGRAKYEPFVPFLRSKRVWVLNVQELQKQVEAADLFSAVLLPQNQQARRELIQQLEAIGQAWVDLARSDDEKEARTSTMRDLLEECRSEDDSRQLSALQSLLDNADPETKAQNQEIRELLCYAYLGKFEYEGMVSGITMPWRSKPVRVEVAKGIDWKDPKVSADFARGIFASYVLDRGVLPKGHHKITPKTIEEMARTTDILQGTEIHAAPGADGR